MFSQDQYLLLEIDLFSSHYDLTVMTLNVVACVHLVMNLEFSQAYGNLPMLLTLKIVLNSDSASGKFKVLLL